MFLRVIPHLRLLWTHRRARPLFDKEFYLARYPDVAAAGADPWLHYLMHGAAERRKPHPLFDPNYYLSQHPEGLLSTGDPLMHFLEAPNWADPHPLFNSESYLRAHPAAAAQRINPLLHYVQSKRDQLATPEGGSFGVT